ncbi:MAG: prenyltransferase [Pedosphaera sp.]|nr:prenyltransferase [Pedosphaera sp.]
MPTLRTLLVLGRVSNLPTVWSNCLAGWLLGGGGDWWRFGLLCAGATCVYVGGMYLNDAFDTQFDQQHRSERPIPSGAISSSLVWRLGFTWLAAGVAALFLLGPVPAALTVGLSLSVLVYDAIHKIFAFSPVLMAACRFFLYLVAATATGNDLTGLAVWSALALAAYIVGLTHLAKKESVRGALRFWPCLLLGAPILLALLINTGAFQQPALLLGAALALWVLRCARRVWWTAQRDIGRAVSGLLAGIVLVDLLTVADQPPVYGAVFLGLFLLALLFQRFVPAT